MIAFFLPHGRFFDISSSNMVLYRFLHILFSHPFLQSIILYTYFVLILSIFLCYFQNILLLFLFHLAHGNDSCLFLQSFFAFLISIDSFLILRQKKKSQRYIYKIHRFITINHNFSLYFQHHLYSCTKNEFYNYFL